MGLAVKEIKVKLLDPDAADLARKAKAKGLKKAEHVRKKLGYAPKLATGAAAHKREGKP